MIDDGRDGGGAVLVDARGLACPLPLVRLRQALMLVEAGTRICLLATDPQTPEDVEAYAEASGHRLLSVEARGGTFVVLVEKRAGPGSG